MSGRFPIQAVQYAGDVTRVTPVVRELGQRGRHRARVGHGRGDQIIQMIVDTPKNLTKRQEELFKELAEIDGKDTKDTLKGFFQKLMG